MKLLNIATIGTAAVMLAACADDFNTNDFKVEPSAETSQYEWLNEYGAIKSYINYSNVGPLFRLGGALDASEMNKRGLVYALAVANYDEVTFGNHMKHNFVMNADGAMDFGTIRTAIETARNGGLKIFGHTLCWHSQQRGSYLLSLLQDKELDIDPDQKNEVVDYEIDWGTQSGYSMWGQWGKGATAAINTDDGCLEVVNPEAADNFWDLQFFIADGFNIVKDTEYTLTVTARTLGGEANIRGGIGTWSETASVNYTAGPEWKDYTFTFTPAFEGGSHLLTQCGDFVGTVQFKSVKLTHKEAAAVTIRQSLINGGDADNGTTENILSRTPGSGDNAAPVVDDPAGTGKVYVAEIAGNPANDYDSQLFITTSTALKEGDKIHVKFRYRCSDVRSISTQAHGAPGSYLHWQFIGTLNCTTEWKDFEYSGAITAEQAGSDGCRTIAFNLASAPDAAQFYIDDVEFDIEKSANAIPLTPEEKAEILKGELKRWIYGMMEACDGYVTAWDVVNEAIADGGSYGVKYGEDTDNEFYWQNYLGENYVRYAVQYAREAFAEYGGNPDELLLFANDYNLEAAYNNTAKTDGLIRTIRQWEADGVTRIDGIGTQMHVTYSLNPEYQAKQEQCVVDMFTKLAASGKLIHVSELDMGIQDEQGNTIMTPDLTYEQKLLMSDYYKFIVTKFFEIIPKEQQYGIVQWAATDSPEGSGWRAGEPIGIWDSNYSRKPAYAGWCDALKEATGK
ncbi:MAG: endo-1,4-beta-xylanase [Muribaculaceae bacterium]|nr:endo-1,4-beta-xylanase [Muribaculaceae bacterium]